MLDGVYVKAFCLSFVMISMKSNHILGMVPQFLVTNFLGRRIKKITFQWWQTMVTRVIHLKPLFAWMGDHASRSPLSPPPPVCAVTTTRAADVSSSSWKATGWTARSQGWSQQWSSLSCSSWWCWLWSFITPAGWRGLKDNISHPLNSTGRLSQESREYDITSNQRRSKYPWGIYLWRWRTPYAPLAQVWTQLELEWTKPPETDWLLKITSHWIKFLSLFLFYSKWQCSECMYVERTSLM